MTPAQQKGSSCIRKTASLNLSCCCRLCGIAMHSRYPLHLVMDNPALTDDLELFMYRLWKYCQLGYSPQYRLQCRKYWDKKMQTLRKGIGSKENSSILYSFVVLSSFTYLFILCAIHKTPYGGGGRIGY